MQNSPLVSISVLPIGLIAVWKDGAAQLIPNKFGEYLTPSIISMDENNHILVGKTGCTHGVLRIRIKRQRYLNGAMGSIPTGG
ncbi:hypothetical protein O5707_18685 [Escherichia coli]|nr:hypothetical protein [Escherichia coli]